MPLKQGFEFRFKERSRLTIGTEYSGTGMFRCTVSRLHTHTHTHTHTHIYNLYIYNFIFYLYISKS